LKAECKPATVKFTFTGDSADLVTLKAAIETNLPKIWLAAKTRGRIAVAAAGRVVTAGLPQQQQQGPSAERPSLASARRYRPPGLQSKRIGLG